MKHYNYVSYSTTSYRDVESKGWLTTVVTAVSHCRSDTLITHSRGNCLPSTLTYMLGFKRGLVRFLLLNCSQPQNLGKKGSQLVIYE